MIVQVIMNTGNIGRENSCCRGRSSCILYSHWVITTFHSQLLIVRLILVPKMVTECCRYGTLIQEGGAPIKYDPKEKGKVEIASAAKEVLYLSQRFY